MPRPKRAATCGHGDAKGRGLCSKCYSAVRYKENREKILAANYAYAKANREAVHARRKAWREANKERERAAARAYYLAHREEYAERDRISRERNSEARRVRQAGRRARQKGLVATLTTAEWLAILDEFDHRCAYCNLGDLPLQQEHMTPISRGGAHAANNVVPACQPCNLQKFTRTALEYVGPATLRNPIGAPQP